MEQIRRIFQRSIFDNETNRRVSLEHRSYINYLIGVLVYENLSWKNHVDCVIAEISDTIQMIVTCKLRCIVPSSVFINIYKSFILPNLTYGLPA